EAAAVAVPGERAAGGAAVGARHDRADGLAGVGVEDRDVAALGAALGERYRDLFAVGGRDEVVDGRLSRRGDAGWVADDLGLVGLVGGRQRGEDGALLGRAGDLEEDAAAVLDGRAVGRLRRAQELTQAFADRLDLRECVEDRAGVRRLRLHPALGRRI